MITQSQFNHLKSRLMPNKKREGWIDEPAEQYHSGTGLGSSHLKTILKSTKAFASAYLEPPREPTPSMRLGTLAHAYILEGQVPLAQPILNKNSNAWKEWLASQPSNALLCTADELESLRQMKQSVMKEIARFEHIGLDFEEGIAEKSGYAWSEDHGIQLRIRPDLRFEKRGIIFDLKTCSDASPEAFLRSVVDYRYDIQAAYYLHVANRIEAEIDPTYTRWVWIAVQTKPPYDAVLYSMSEEWLQKGVDDMHRALNLISFDLTAGGLTGYSVPGTVNILEKPSWLKD